MPGNHFMAVADIAKALNLRENLLYGWAAANKLEKKKSPEGIMLLSMDTARDLKSKLITKTFTKKHVVKAAPKKRHPATKQADRITRHAAVLEIFFPEGIPVKQYVNALLLGRALDAVTL